MKKIPTGEEFLNDFNKKHGNIDKLYYDAYIKRAMIEFAKLHVEAALEYASGKVQLSQELYDSISDSWESGEWFDKNSILNAYPLSNIK